MKETTLPKIKTKKECKTLRFENTPIAFVQLETLEFVPTTKIDEKIEKYYFTLFDKYSNWINTHFYKHIARIYQSDENPRKRFRFKPFLLEYTMLYEFINDRFLSIEIQVSLKREKNEIGYKQLNHLWDLSNGLLQIQKAKRKTSADICGRRD